MTETIALVTGANRGIGKEISRQLAAKGVLVIMGAREPERGEQAVAEWKAQGLPAEFVQLDVTSQASVHSAAAEVERRHGRLDILVNNAGIALDWVPASELTADALEKTFETNVVGAFRVTQAFLPLLKKSKRGRIVNVSSRLGSLTVNADPNNSLAARNHAARLLRVESRAQHDHHSLCQFAERHGNQGEFGESRFHRDGYESEHRNQNRGAGSRNARAPGASSRRGPYRRRVQRRGPRTMVKTVAEPEVKSPSIEAQS